MPTSDSARSRLAFAAIFLACVGLLSYAFYLQHWKNLDPCPWCIVQRAGFIVVGCIALAGALHRGKVVYAGLGLLASVAGMAAAAYHVYLQADPVRAAKCVGSPVERILDQLQVGKLLPALLQYDGPCTLKPWSLLGLSIPEWSAVWFVILAAAFAGMLINGATRTSRTNP
jgi:protein dithiol:quinone oxidoreductase